MKRITAVTLAVILAFSMSMMTAYACSLHFSSNPSEAAYGYSVHMPGTGGSPGTTDGADIIDDAEIDNFPALVLGTDNITRTLPVRWQYFEVWDAAANAYVPASNLFNSTNGPEIIDEEVMDHMKLCFTDPATKALFREPHKNPYQGSVDANFLLIAERIGMAKEYVYIEFYHDDRTVTTSRYYPINGQVIDPTVNKAIVGLKDKDLTDIETRVNGGELTDSATKGTVQDQLKSLEELPPDSTISFMLNTEYFVWEPRIDEMSTSVRKSTLDTSRIDVAIKVSVGKKLIESVEIENIGGVAHVVVNFVEEFVSTEERDFDFYIYLTYDKKMGPTAPLQISGSLINEVYYVDGMDYVYMGDGLVAAVDIYTKNIQMDLGNGMNLYRSLYAGKKYYGVTSTEATDSDREVMSAYPAIRKVINLKAVNLDAVGNIVRFELPDFDDEVSDGNTPPQQFIYYVYDEDGQYLGMQNEQLPYRTKYYFATQNLALDMSVTAGALDQMSDMGDYDGMEWDNENHNPATGGARGLDAILGSTAVMMLALGALLSAPGRRGTRKEDK